MQVAAAMGAGHHQRYLQSSQIFLAHAFDQVQRKVGPHAGAQHLGDHKAALPLTASTCRKPNAQALRKIEPTLPASCTRSSTTVVAIASKRLRSEQTAEEAHARRRFQPAADVLEKRIWHHYDFDSCQRFLVLPLRPIRR